MTISEQELRAFANSPNNKIELRQCDRNAYRFYKYYASKGALIY